MSSVLVIEWSLSGQSREVTNQLVEPLIEAGHDVTRVTLETEADYPFPWSPVQFFGVFPEAVLMRPPPARPITLPDSKPDLVIASGSIWYLRPCLPWQSFLAGPQADWLDGQRVLTLTTCRNMWVTGWNVWVDWLGRHGADVVDRITVTHSGPVFASFFSTLFWSITGERENLALPKVEIDDATMGRVRGYGELLAERLPGEGSLLQDVETASVSHAHAFGELAIGAPVFPLLAGIYAALSSPGSVLRGFFALFQMAFVINLVVWCAIPVLTVHALFRGRIDSWIDRQVLLPSRRADADANG